MNWCSSCTASEWAAWVQAVGSVFGILIAVAVPVVFSWLGGRNEKKRRHEKMLNAAIQVYEPVCALAISLDDHLEQMVAEHGSENASVRIDPNEGEFQKLIPSVLATMVALDDLGSLAPNLRRLLFKLMELDRFLRMIPVVQRSGSPAFFINNFDDIRAQIKGALDCANDVVAGVRKLSEQGHF